MGSVVSPLVRMPQWWSRRWPPWDAPHRQKVALCIISLRVHAIPLRVAPMPAVRYDLNGCVKTCIRFIIYQEYMVIVYCCVFFVNLIWYLYLFWLNKHCLSLSLNLSLYLNQCWPNSLTHICGTGGGGSGGGGSGGGVGGWVKHLIRNYLQEDYLLCIRFVFWCLIPWIDHKSPVGWAIFRILFQNESWFARVTGIFIFYIFQCLNAFSIWTIQDFPIISI